MKPEAVPLDATVTSVTDAGLLAPGTVLAGRYRILALLGVGGMGVVYRAHDQELELDVAIKLLRPEQSGDQELQRRLRQELLLARQVSHRNVVRIHDIGQDGPLIFLSMDYVDGRSLRQVLEEDGPFAAEEAAAIGEQLAGALSAAHAAGVVHRDLKPGNVMIDGDGRALITDFGIARSVLRQGLTRTGSVVGTPDYLSPEQAKGEKVDHRSDLYALGLMLYEMASGELPFVAETFSEVLAQRVSGRPRNLAETGIEAPAYFEAVIARCLERDPERRYQDGEAVAADLAARQAGPGPGPVASWLRTHRKRLTLAAAALVTLVAVVALAVLALRQRAVPTSPAAAEALHAVAILPLVDQTGRADLAWLATGVPEMVAADLGESPALRVVDSLRVQRTLEDLKLTPQDGLAPRELVLLGELLDVGRLVTGRVQAAGERIRVDASLHDLDQPASPAERIEIEAAGPDDVFGAVARLGAALRQRLELPAAAAGEAPATRSAAALEAFSRGSRLISAGDLLGAREAFEEAVASDPSFDRAWLRLGEVHGDLGSPDQGLAAVRRGLELLAPGAERLRLEGEALEAALAGKPEQARIALEALVERFPNDVRAQVQLAGGWADEGRYDRAIPILEAVVEREPNHPQAWYLLGRYSILQGDNRRAIDDYLVRALVIENRLGNDQGRADVLNALGVASQRLGELETARDYYRQAGELREAIGDLRGYASSLANLARILVLEGRYDEAISQLDRALELRESIGDRAGLAALENQLGSLEERRGRYRRALERFRRALQVRRELGEQRSIAESAYNVGFVYYLLGEYDNAAVYQQQALDIHRQSGNREGVVFATQSLGQLELARGDWDAALRAFLEALETSRELGLQEAEAVTLASLGRVAYQQGRLAAALESLTEAANAFAAIEHMRGKVEVALYRAETWLAVGRFEAAADALDRAETWLGEAENREQRAVLLRLRGLLALARGAIPQAISTLGESSELAAASGDLAVELASRLAQAHALLAAGDPAAARTVLEPAAARIERLGHLALRLAAGELEIAILAAVGETAAAEEAARRTIALAGRHAPFHATYRLHLAHADLLAARGADAEAAAALAEAAREVERLRQGLDEVDRQAFDSLEAIRRIAGAGEDA